MNIVITKQHWLRNKIMDLRDERVRLQREVSALEDIQFWTPWSFTTEQAQHLARLQTTIQKIKTKEQTLHQEVYYA